MTTDSGQVWEQRALMMLEFLKRSTLNGPVADQLRTVMIRRWAGQWLFYRMVALDRILGHVADRADIDSTALILLLGGMPNLRLFPLERRPQLVEAFTRDGGDDDLPLIERIVGLLFLRPADEPDMEAVQRVCHDISPLLGEHADFLDTIIQF